MDGDIVIRQGKGKPFKVDDAMEAFENEQRILRSIKPREPFESLEEWKAWANSIIPTQGVTLGALFNMIYQQKDLTLQYLYLLHEQPQPALIPKDTLDRKCFICGCDSYHLSRCETFHARGFDWAEKDLCSNCYDRLSRHWWGRLRLWLHRIRKGGVKQ